MTKRMFLVHDTSCCSSSFISAATVFRGDIEKQAEKKENAGKAIGSHVAALEDASSKRTPSGFEQRRARGATAKMPLNVKEGKLFSMVKDGNCKQARIFAAEKPRSLGKVHFRCEICRIFQARLFI